MSADLIGGQPVPQRPFGVSALAVLAAIGAVLGVLFILGGGGLIAMALTFLGALTAYGLWNLRPWGWPLGLLTWILGTIEAVLLLTVSTFNTNLVVGPLAVWYLLRPDIRALFRRG